jgi:hypothetical protein
VTRNQIVGVFACFLVGAVILTIASLPCECDKGEGILNDVASASAEMNPGDVAL